MSVVFSSLLKGGARRGAVPLRILSPKAFAGWEKKQPAFPRAWIKARGFKPKAGESLVLPDKSGKIAQVVACVSDPVEIWDLAGLARGLPKGTYKLEGASREEETKLALGWLLGSHCFSRYKKDEGHASTLCLSKKTDLRPIALMAETIAWVRDLITMPAEDLGPAELAEAARETARRFGAKVKEIVGDDLLKKNYPAIHAVGRASPRAPRLIDLTWGHPKHPKVTLVGKGVCFDTGGLDIKSSAGMFLMRKDMAGAAIALGLARLVMARKLPVRLRVLIPAVENAVDGRSFRPSDIIKMRSGLTVEVGNTDAEGRLVLADALAEAASEKPELLIDFATLTGASRTALGTELSALFTDDEALAIDLMAAGQEQEDPLWRLPLYKGYEKMLKSAFADIGSSANSPYAGAITAALFLQRFIPKNLRWAHLDLMGWNVSSRPGRPEGGEAMALRAVFTMLEKRFPRT